MGAFRVELPTDISTCFLQRILSLKGFLNTSDSTVHLQLLQRSFSALIGHFVSQTGSEDVGVVLLVNAGPPRATLPGNGGKESDFLYLVLKPRQG